MEQNDKKFTRYDTLLLALVCYWILASMVRMFVIRYLGLHPTGDTAMQVMILQFVIWFDVVYVVFGLTTLGLRFRGSSPAPVVTKVLNIFLLWNLPLGTALGIYGLLRANESPDGTGAPEAAR